MMCLPVPWQPWCNLAKKQNKTKKKKKKHCFAYLGTFMYKHHSNQLPPISSTYFTRHVQTHHCLTRNAQDYSINNTKKIFSDCAIRNCGPTFWNSLDKSLKHCKTTKHFRNQLKSALLSKYDWYHFWGHVLCIVV